MVKYRVLCPNCQMTHSVEITDRQRHEEDFDISLEYARKTAIPGEDVTLIANKMYEQKCTDHRGRKANENNIKLEDQRHENRLKMERFKIKAKQWPYNK